VVEKDFQLANPSEADLFVHQIAKNWKQANLAPADQALCEFAEQLTHAPQQMNKEHTVNLQKQGFCDQAIHDASQVISYFNYINRIADSLDVDLEKEVHAWELGVPESDKRSEIASS